MRFKVVIMIEQPNFYATIPATVRYSKDISNGAKLLYGEITALCNKKGYCWASNAYFAELYNNSNKTISRWVSELEASGFIIVRIDKKDGTKRHISLPEARTKKRRGMDKNGVGYGQKCPDPMDKNEVYNNTVINTSNVVEEKEKNSTTTPSKTEFKSELIWQMEYEKDETKKQLLTDWAKQTIREQLPRILTVHGKQYTDEQLTAWIEYQLVQKPIELLKTKFTPYGHPLSSDTVKHIVNTANWQLTNRGGLDIPQTKRAAVSKKANNHSSPFK